MLLLSLILVAILLILIVKWVLPIFKRHSQLQKDYENISPLSISPIPFVGNLHHFDKQTHIFYKQVLEWAKQCQDEDKGLFCIWYALVPIVFTCSGKGLESFINNSKQLVKSYDYRQLEPWIKTGLLTSNHEKWRSRRRLITPSFHDTQLLHNFVDIFNEQASILARRFGELAKQPEKTNDPYPYISACTLDIITEAAAGANSNAQSGDVQNEFLEATIKISETFSVRSRWPWLWPDFIFDRSPTGHQQREALKILHGFTRKIIEERRATFNVEQVVDGSDKKSARRLVFLDSLLTQMHNEKLTLDDIQEEVDTFIFEGHDTTATAITFCCYLVGCYPEVQAKIHAEMDSIFGDDHERACTLEDIQKMTYLDCVIKECMRVLPPVPGIGREAQEDFVYRDQIIRKGTTIMILIHAIHHDANVFPNPEKFDPDRFADSSSTSNERSPFAYIPFSAGSRNCIGQRFAALEERVLLSTLFRHFSFHSTQTIEELNLRAQLVLRPVVPIQMTIKQR